MPATLIAHHDPIGLHDERPRRRIEGRGRLLGAHHGLRGLRIRLLQAHPPLLGILANRFGGDVQPAQLADLPPGVRKTRRGTEINQPVRHARAR